MNNILIATIISTIVFIVLTFTPLFNYVNKLLTDISGYELGDNIYIVILIHAFIFGLLIYLILISFKESDNKNIVSEDKSDEPEDKLEAFDVGGSLTCK